MSVDGNVFPIDTKSRFKLREEFIDRYRGREPQWGPVGEVVFLRTYSRKVGNRQERFWETCRRVVEGTFSAIAQATEGVRYANGEETSMSAAEDMYDRMFNFQFLPPGRGLQFMGTDAVEKRGSAVLQNCGFRSTRELARNFSAPFCDVMDLSMLGVGMGFDLLGANQVRITLPLWNTHTPFIVEDSREGWIAAVRMVLDAFVGIGALATMVDYSKVRPSGEPLKTLGGTASGPAPLHDLLESLTTLLNQRKGMLFRSVDIVDVMNMIGKCVVSGNIRRSSELALGSAEDVEFVSMKDPENRNTWRKAQQRIEDGSSEARTLLDKIASLVERTAKLSPTDPLCVVAAREAEGLRKERQELLRANPAWMEFQTLIDTDPLSSHRWASNNSVMVDEKTNFGPLVELTKRNGDPGYVFMKTITSRGRLSDPHDDKDIKVLGLNPCGEQPLENEELCTLVEVFPTNCSNINDFKATLKAAFLYAKAVTLIPTHRAQSNIVMQRNRRIGVSLAGTFDMVESRGLDECRTWWRAGFDELLAHDRRLSLLWCIPESNRHTTIKPGGSVPLLPGIEGGMKVPTHRYGFRTVRFAEDSPLVGTLVEAGYRVEPDVVSPRTMVAYFPIESRSERTAKDVSMREQLELCAELQEHWSDNGVSVTVMFQPHEADDMAKALEDYSGRLKAVSFLPLNDHSYVQAPYIECTQEEHDAYEVCLQPLPDAYGSDVHDSNERFCTGGVCELPQTV